MNRCKDCERETTCKIRKGSHKYCFKAKNKEELTMTLDEAIKHLKESLNDPRREWCDAIMDEEEEFE